MAAFRNSFTCSVWQTSNIRSSTLFVRNALRRHSVLRMAFWQNQNDIEIKSIGTVSRKKNIIHFEPKFQQVLSIHFDFTYQFSVWQEIFWFSHMQHSHHTFCRQNLAIEVIYFGIWAICIWSLHFVGISTNYLNRFQKLDVKVRFLVELWRWHIVFDFW